MKRDLDLIRKLVLAVEVLPTGFSLEYLTIDGYTDEQIGYHSYLICDSGWAVGIDRTELGDKSPQWIISHLTSAGHDFADASRSDTVWSKVRTRIATVGGSASLDVVKEVLGSAAKATLGI